jgi:hypothetical protein
MQVSSVGARDQIAHVPQELPAQQQARDNEQDPSHDGLGEADLVRTAGGG